MAQIRCFLFARLNYPRCCMNRRFCRRWRKIRARVCYRCRTHTKRWFCLRFLRFQARRAMYRQNRKYQTFRGF